MDLARYLERIGHLGTMRPDLATLRAICRGHVENIPYENLDVQLKRKVSRAVPAIFEKIVERRRGGWCYEMNGLLSWALEEAGFSVTRLAGAVMRDQAGDAAIGNHLVLLIDLDGAYVADAGFGDGLIEPVPLRAGRFAVGPMSCALIDLGGGWMRYVNDSPDGGPSFDFNPDVRDDALLERSCRFLQSDPTSPFVQNAVVQRWREERHYSMRGRVLTILSIAGRDRRLIDDAQDYARTLRDTFALDIPEAVTLWPQIAARHEALFALDGQVR